MLEVYEMMRYSRRIYVFLCLCCFSSNVYGFTGEVASYADPATCSGQEYFHILRLKCVNCDPNLQLQPTRDRFSCECNSQSRIVKSYGLEFPTCELCPPTSFPSSDRTKCLQCQPSVDNQTKSAHNVTKWVNNYTGSCMTCQRGQIIVERELNGSSQYRRCESCTSDTVPDRSGSSCIPCYDGRILVGKHDCSCPAAHREFSNGICVPNEIFIKWPDDRKTYTIQYDSGLKIVSHFFETQLLPAVSLCKLKNITACQMVANMCTMVLFADDYEGSPCKLFQDSRRIPTSESTFLPWLFYGEGNALTVLGRKTIPTQYSLLRESSMSKLNLTVARFSPTGTFKGLTVASGSLLQLCPGSWNTLDAGLRFGAQYHHTCTIPAQQLLQADTEFLDLYLQYMDGSESRLYAVPVLTRNMMKGTVRHNNKGSDPAQWLLTRRFFLVDKISGIQWELGKQEKQLVPSGIRYLKSCELRVKLRSWKSQGQIYPPLFVVTYGELRQDDIEANRAVSISFTTDYDMPNDLTYSLEVSMGVFCSLAVVWSGMEAWSCSRRSGRLGIDLHTIAQLAISSCGNLGNIFFLVVSCASTYMFFFYKGESVLHVLLPSKSQEKLIQTYVIVAFALKVIEITCMIWRQISVDIFFIDWERPKAVSYDLRPNTPGSDATVGESVEQRESVDQPISIWRTYFVANEWSEIQAKRKISVLFQLILTIFILKVLHVENWGVADPDLSTEVPEYMANSPPSFTCRFAVAVLVYVIVYFFQWLYMVLFHERFIKNSIQQFVDVCSVANISVFILALENFGYYIHGRSAHGFADTDMQTIITQLQREEEDLCGHRGLVLGSDQQTFQMTVPKQLRSYYRKVMMPISPIILSTKRLSSAGAGGLRTRMASGDVDRSILAYHSMNKFLAAFLEHALADLDYDIRDKHFIESLLDIEFTVSTDQGVLYNDNGHSFDRVLFYGKEFTLATFDIILFSFVEVVSHNFLLASIITAAVAKFLVMVREFGGRRNVARKTLIDKRFLI